MFYLYFLYVTTLSLSLLHQTTKRSETKENKKKKTRLTEEGKDGREVPMGGQAIFAFHHNLTEESRRRPIHARNHVDTVGVGGRRFSRQLTLHGSPVSVSQVIVPTIESLMLQLS